MLNEQIILQQLNPALPSEADPDEMRTVFALSILDCYDRKVEREFMWDMIVQLVRAVTCLKQLEIVGRIDYNRAIEAQQKGEPVQASDELKALVKQLKGIQSTVYAKMQLVAQCPTDQDTVS